MEINQKKYLRQQIAWQRWKANNCIGAWEWVTGMGKTFGAVEMTNKMVAFNNSWSIFIVVPNDTIKAQWQKTIVACVAPELHFNYQVKKINEVMEESLQGKVQECNTLILDEAHEYYTEERIKIFFGAYIKFSRLLALTANYEDKDNRHKLIEEVCPIVDYIGYDEAEREGYISNFIEFNVPVDLTEKEREQYDILSKTLTKNLSKLGKNGLEVANKVLSTISKKDWSYVSKIAASNGWRNNLNKFDERERIIDETWAPGKIVGYAVNSLNTIRDRKNIVYNAINKVRIAVDIVAKFENLRFICFSQTTHFADLLARQINDYYGNPLKPVCVVFHSKIATKIIEDPITGKQKKKGSVVLKREALEAVKSGEARGISTATALDKGLNIEELELGISASGTQNFTQYNQRKGRSLRLLEGEDKLAILINLFARNTIDEQWLKKRQSKGTNVIYYVDSVNEINYNPRSKETFNIQEV